jgi:flagellar biosynthesis protein FliR
MIEVYKFSQSEILSFILVLLRISTFLVAWPVFGSSNVPAPVKILLGLILTVILFPIAGRDRLDAAALDQYYFWLMMREAFVGIAMGFLARFFFFAISICAQIVSDSIGLSSIQLLNPTTSDRSTAVEEFYTMLATLLFLGMNGHHLFISGLAKSYEMIPLSLKGLELAALGNMAALTQIVTIIGVKLAAPVFIAVFLMNIAMGIVGRAVPQINVFVTSMPVNILVGLFVLIISVPLLLTGMGDLLNDTLIGVFGILKSL